MSAKFVRFLLTLALAAQGPISDLDPGAAVPARRGETASLACAWSEVPKAADVCVRADASDDDDSSELDESGTPCLPVSSGGPPPRRAIHLVQSIASPAPPSQSRRGPGPSRAPPFR